VNQSGTDSHVAGLCDLDNSYYSEYGFFCRVLQ
jgi:hypothetical protein